MPSSRPSTPPMSDVALRLRRRRLVGRGRRLHELGVAGLQRREDVRAAPRARRATAGVRVPGPPGASAASWALTRRCASLTFERSASRRNAMNSSANVLASCAARSGRRVRRADRDDVGLPLGRPRRPSDRVAGGRPAACRAARCATVSSETSATLVAAARFASGVGSRNDEPKSFWSSAGSRNSSDAEAVYCASWRNDRTTAVVGTSKTHRMKTPLRRRSACDAL